MGDEGRGHAHHKGGVLHEELEAALVEGHRQVGARVFGRVAVAMAVPMGAVALMGVFMPAAGERKKEQGEESGHPTYYRR